MSDTLFELNYVNAAVIKWGWDNVYAAVMNHPACPQRFSQVDAPPTAKRAASTRFTQKSIKAKLLRIAITHKRLHRDEAIDIYAYRENVTLNYSQRESVRRRWDELVETGLLQEVDNNGRVRVCAPTSAGRIANERLIAQGTT